MVQAVLTGWLTVSGFDLAWFSSVFQAPLCLRSSWCYKYISNFYVTGTFFSELSLVGLALDVVD